MSAASVALRDLLPPSWPGDRPRSRRRRRGAVEPVLTADDLAALELIEVHGVIESPCWLAKCSWTGDGYASWAPTGTRKRYRLHRQMYLLLVGSVPVGRMLHHRCLVKPCVNPDHLQPVSASEHACLHRLLTDEAAA